MYSSVFPEMAAESYPAVRASRTALFPSASWLFIKEGFYFRLGFYKLDWGLGLAIKAASYESTDTVSLFHYKIISSESVPIVWVAVWNILSNHIVSKHHTFTTSAEIWNDVMNLCQVAHTISLKVEWALNGWPNYLQTVKGKLWLHEDEHDVKPLKLVLEQPTAALAVYMMSPPLCFTVWLLLFGWWLFFICFAL